MLRAYTAHEFKKYCLFIPYKLIRTMNCSIMFLETFFFIRFKLINLFNKILIELPVKTNKILTFSFLQQKKEIFGIVSVIILKGNY